MLLLTYTEKPCCSHCSQYFLNSEELEQLDDDILICSECRKLYFICAECSEVYNKEDEHEYNHEDEIYCEDCYNEKYFTCSNCNEIHLYDESFCYEDELYCEDCYNENFIMCEYCGETIKQDDSFVANGSYYCESCYHEYYIECYSCGSVFSVDDVYYNEHDEEYYCESCYSEYSFDEFDSSPLCLDDNTYNKIKYSRCYGIELEISDDSIDYEEIRNKTSFGCKEDCSINQGSEIVSPILQGDIGISEIEKLCSIVKNCENDSSSGFHLHMDYRKECEDWYNIKKTWLLYNRIECLLYDILPESRQENRYCHKQKLDFSRILDIDNNESLHSLFYSSENENGTRYFGINIHSIYTNRTLEIRYHNGTQNFEKIVSWIDINICLLEYSLNNNIDEILELTENKGNLIDYIKILEKIGCKDETITYYKRRYNKFNYFVNSAVTLG